jgi:2-keto-4-pentenoate hydratase/2-oxohepta-3-ene-1,7-dioic acid hydratase in catechol pathway
VIDVSSVEGLADGQWPPVAMNRLIADFAKYRPALEKAAQGPGVPLSSVKLLTPVPWPNKVIAYPVNYHDHGAEMGANYRATVQGWFLKPNSSLSGAGEPIVLPELPGRRIDHECELAIIIGKQGRNVRREDWRDYVFGYACLLDMVVRGKEERVFRKGFDTFCPVGPWITTADEISDPTAIEMKLWVNGELRQHANTRDLVLDIPGMVEMAAAVSTIYPGDIIATGTPAGVGPVRPGDKVRIAIEQVGEMTLDVIQGKGGFSQAFADKPA